MYTRIWDETSPPGTILANTIDTEFQHTKTDIAERLESIFGLTALEFAADPIVPKTLSLATGLTANVTGNLTGTVLTAAQPNITSHGTLTVLNVSGISTLGRFLTQSVVGFGDVHHQLVSTGVGHINWDITKSFTVANALQFVPSTLGDGIIFTTPVMTLTNVGVLSTVGGFSGNVTGTILTAAQPNITSLGIQTVLQLSQPGGLALGNPVTYAFRFDAGNFVIGSDATHIYLQTFSTKSLELNNQGNNVNIGGQTTVAAGLIVTGNIVGTLIGNVSGNLTGTVLTAAQPNITSHGILTSLNTSGLVTHGSGLSPTTVIQDVFGSSSVISSIGTAQSSGYLSLAYNATQTGANGSGVDNWAQSNGALASSILQISNVNVKFYTRALGAVNGTFAAFWGAATATIDATGFAGNFTGNLTGTILTAAQPNITSHGTLTSLNVAGNIVMTGGTFTGLGKFSLGNGLGAQITLAKVSTVAPIVANAAQQAWLRVIGDDAVTYYLPAFN